MKRLKWIGLPFILLLGLTLIWMPPERHLGRLLTLIYLHGALIRTGALLFSLGGVIALVALATRDKRTWEWMYAFQVTAWGTWVLGFLLSIYPSFVTWGAPVVWGEPRTRMVLQVALVSGLLFLVGWWLGARAWSAVMSLVVGGLVPLLVWRTGVIRHPLNPIGTSPSTTFRLAYAIVLFSIVVLAGVVTAWVQAWLGQTPVVEDEEGM